MMSSEIEYRYRPGLLDFGLSASKAEGLYQLDSGISTTKLLLSDYKGFESTEFAILNLQGALLYYKHEYEEACNIFKDIFKRSHFKNLNACSNLEYVYRKLGYWTEAETVKRDLVKFDIEGKDDQLQKHQYLREQAFAILFDCHVSVQLYERYKRAVKLLELCSTDSECDAEINQQWKLWYAQSLLRILGHCKGKDSSIKLKYINKGIYALSEIIVSKDQADPRLESMAYTCMGQFMFKAKNEKDFIESVEQWSNMPVKQWYDNPEECFTKAMQLHVNAEVITRYALYLSGKRDVKNLQKAVSLFEIKHETKEDDVSETEVRGRQDTKEEEPNVTRSWFALSVRSKAFLELSRKLEDNKDEIRDGTPNSQTTALIGENDNASKNKVSGDITVDGVKTTKQECEEHEIPGNNAEGCISNDQMRKELGVQIKGDSAQSLDEDVSADGHKIQGQAIDKIKILEYTKNECLEKAIQYGEKSIELNPTVEQFHNVGCAYHMKAKTVKDKSEQRSVYFEALSYFLHALNHLDGSKIPYVHTSQGNCLLEMKQYRPAVECFKRAIAVGTINKQIYHFLFKGYIDLLREVWNNEHEKEETIKEIIYWLQYTKSNGTAKGILGSLLELESLEPIAEDSPSKKHVVAAVIGEMLRNGIDVEDVKYALPDECLDRKTQGSVQLAMEVLGALVQANHVDQTYREYVLGLIDEEVVKQFPEKEQQWSVKMLKESFCQCRETCHEQIDFSVLNIFKQVHESCPFLANKVTTKMAATDCDKFAQVLLKHVEIAVNLESEQLDEVWASEALDQVLHTGETAGLYFAKLQRQMCRLERSIHQKKISQQTTISKREPKVRQSKFDYDFFVLHSETEEDRKWVLFELLPTLECQFGFKGCVEERDSRPGTPRIQEMNKLHEKSFKILIILSKHSKSDPLCKFAMHNALFGKMGKNNVIPVLKDEVEIPDELRTIVFMSAVKNFDWERLVRALEAD